MGLLDDVMALDAIAFTDPELMPGCESVVYTRAASGATRTINAWVDRAPAIRPSQFDPGAGAAVPRLVIKVRNDATVGISAAELDAGDTITIAKTLGGSTEAIDLPPNPFAADSGMLEFRIY